MSNSLMTALKDEALFAERSKGKATLVIDSQHLSEFQKCPRRYYHTFIESLESLHKAPPLQKGSCISDALEAYYNAKIEKKSFDECVASGVKIISEFPFNILKDEDNHVDLRYLLLSKFAQYVQYYRNEQIIPFACENNAGFSKVLYEDDRYLFIYEGKPDFTGFADWKTKQLHWMDHKTTSMPSGDLHHHSNQFLGYSWALDSEVGVINYFGLQKGASPEKSFQRALVKFTKADIDDWVRNSIEWCFRLVKARQAWEQGYYVDPEQAKVYLWPKTRASCETKYGLCTYAGLCDTQTLVKIEQLKKQYFRVREEPWKAWR
jgi:hypothetical protein